MKIAVMSCIHGNYEALDAVLRDIDRQKAEKIFCLGDLVGYGPFPSNVVEMVRSLDIPTTQGCWDEDIVEGLNSCECSYPSMLAEKRGRLAHEWTNEHIYPETKEYLAALPKVIKEDNLAFVHGSPQSQHEYLLPELDGFIALERVLSTGADILFCGHTHVPYVRTLDAGHLRLSVRTGAEVSEAEMREFNAPLKRIVNVGSVGEPRHGRPNATYVIYDMDSDRVTLREVEYDYQKTCAAIIERGLPPIFAWRLAKGLEFAERADDASHLCERGI
ncbi:MAG: metallophosphoesterase family protein [Pseudanabaenaceae cyanobacterium]|jgi:diadenosine tetraphosphatase ApaH/serine/threonine PP2A family protein phosphatase